MSLIDSSFIALDATPVKANVCNNNPKSFSPNKFTNKNVYHGDCFIPINQINTKNPKKLPAGNSICDAGLAMHRDGICKDNGRSRQKFCYPFKCTQNASCPSIHKNFKATDKATGCTKHITTPDDYRLYIDRNATTFKSVYPLRTEA